MPNDNGVDNPNAAASANADEKKYVTLDDLEKLFTERLPKVVNAAVTAHSKRIAKDFDEKLAKALAPKPEGDDATAEPGDADPSAQAQGKATPKPQQQPAASPELVTLQKQLVKMQADLAKTQGDLTSERTARAKAERQRVEEQAYSTVRTALAGKVIAGVEGDVLDLLRSRNALVVGDDGSVRLKLRASADEPEEGLDLDTGLPQFLKTKPHFLPAPNAGPSGGKQRSAPANPGGPPQRGGPTTNAAAAVEQKFGKRIDELVLD